MPRLVPGPARYGYGGMIEGRDYLTVVKVLEDIAEVVGIVEGAGVLTADLPDKVTAALQDQWEAGVAFEHDRVADLDVQLSVAGDEGYAAGVATAQDEARAEGWAAGYAVGLVELPVITLDAETVAADADLAPTPPLADEGDPKPVTRPRRAK